MQIHTLPLSRRSKMQTDWRTFSFIHLAFMSYFRTQISTSKFAFVKGNNWKWQKKKTHWTGKTVILLQMQIGIFGSGLLEHWLDMNGIQFRYNLVSSAYCAFRFIWWWTPDSITSWMQNVKCYSIIMCILQCGTFGAFFVYFLPEICSKWKRAPTGWLLCSSQVTERKNTKSKWCVFLLHVPETSGSDTSTLT